MGEWRMRRFLAAGGTALACKLFDGFRVKAIAVAGLLLILATGSFSQSAFAQSKCSCWKNSKTGQFAPTTPRGGAEVDLTDPNRAFSPLTGDNYYWDQADCQWKNSKTGKAAPDAPRGGAEVDLTDPNRAFSPLTGDNYYRVVPCPPQTATTTPPPGPPSVGMLIVEPRGFFDLIKEADARTAGVPKPSEETQKVEEKKPSFWETLIPAVIPSIGIGGGREDRERRLPDDRRR